MSTPQSSVTYETLEDHARLEIQRWFQDLWDAELSALLGRARHERRAAIDGPEGYRNGHGKPRRLAMMGGTITVRRPRARDIDERFESRLLPFFVRRTQEVGDLLPELYLHGLAQGDFELALRGLLGEGAPLSASSIERLRAKWQVEFGAWKSRRLDDRELVYVWADGVYVKAGLEKEKAALLVVIGAMSDGRKELLAVEPGCRESSASWAHVLRDLKARGLAAPQLLVADGCAGVWAAAAEIWPEAKEQRCWNHKTMNVLDALPKTVQAEAKEMLRQVAYAPTRRGALRARQAFARRFAKTHPKAVELVEKDWERLTAFYDFPAEHWIHLRTTNVIESPFACVRLRTTAAKRFKRVQNATALIWKVLGVAEQSWRRLNAPELLALVLAGQVFTDGIAAGHPSLKDAA
jgi:transposase-like protein